MYEPLMSEAAEVELCRAVLQDQCSSWWKELPPEFSGDKSRKLLKLVNNSGRSVGAGIAAGVCKSVNILTMALMPNTKRACVFGWIEQIT